MAKIGGNPTDHELTELLAGRLDEARESEIYGWLEQDETVRHRLDLISGEATVMTGLDVTDLEITVVDQSTTQSYADYFTPTDDPDYLGQLGKYFVIEEAGRGGMGVVLKAHDPDLDRTVAIKWLNEAISKKSAGVKRFEREARAIAGIEHPHVLPVYAIDEIQDRTFLVTRFVDGKTLDERLAESPDGLPVEEVIRIAEAVTSALEAVHGEGLVHRDLKLSNIMLEGDGGIWLMDFGLVKTATDSLLTIEGTVVGTPHYMSPEQATGEEVDAASDLYSLGVVMYQLLTGRKPFDSDHLSAVLWQIAEQKAKAIQSVSRTEIPRWLQEVVEELMQKDKAQRPNSATEILETFRSHGDVKLPKRIARRKTRRRMIGLGLVSVVGAGVGGYAIWDHVTADERLKFRNETSGSRHSTLAKAIRRSKDGDTILVDVDTLGEDEGILCEPVEISHSLTLRAAPNRLPVLKFIDAGDKKPRIRVTGGGRIELDNVTVHYQSEFIRPTPFCEIDGGTLRIQFCRIEGNGPHTRDGRPSDLDPFISCFGDATVEVEDTKFLVPYFQAIHFSETDTSKEKKWKVTFARNKLFAHTVAFIEPTKLKSVINLELHSNVISCRRAYTIRRRAFKDESDLFMPETTITHLKNIIDCDWQLIFFLREDDRQLFKYDFPIELTTGSNRYFTKHGLINVLRAGAPSITTIPHWESYTGQTDEGSVVVRKNTSPSRHRRTTSGGNIFQSTRANERS